LAAVVAAVLLGTTGAATQYGAPAGDRKAGPLGASPYNVILPNGRLVVPAGRSVVVGMNALGVAITPDGRYAIVSNDDERDEGMHPRLDPRVTGGYSLAVVDTSSMRVSDVFVADKHSFFVGIAALRDPANRARTIVIASGGPSNQLYVFTLAGGKLKEIAAIALPSPTDPRYANQNHSFPGGLTLARDGRFAYVANNLANSVTAIDLVQRRALHTTGVGFFPYDVALAGNRLLVTNEGLMRYGNLPSPARVPQFANVPAEETRSSSLSAVSLDAGDVASSAQFMPMDRVPDGLRTIGGAHPSAIVTSPDGRYAYVTMTNVDRVAVVSLSGTPRVIGGVQLQLFAGSPYGSQPNAIARSRDGKRLYVALAGMNAVAVLDAHNPRNVQRAGLIPTGWYPTAVAVSPDGRYLYVANAKGIGQERNFQGAPPYRLGGNGRILQSSGDSNTIWATLQRIDLKHVPLEAATLSTLRYLRTVQTERPKSWVPRLRSGIVGPAIKHVVLILEENKTFDSMLGDLTDASGQPHGNGDPSLVSFPQDVTPNLHALARTFGLADNLYADSDESDAGHQFVAGGVASAYSEKTLLVKSGRVPLVNKNEDPEDYPRVGYIFNSLARGNRSYRYYGDYIRLAGYDEGRADNPRVDDPNFRGMNDRMAPTSGLGGLYSLDVPAPLALYDHVDVNYPGWNLRIRDERRAREFIRDYDPLIRAGQMPEFTHIWLPADHGGFGADIPPISEEVADGDRALGLIVDYLTHTPQWEETAIFVMPDDAQSTRDHVSEHRTYAIVISPYVKRGYVGHHHLSTVSVLKTQEELLGLQPLALGDLLASDMVDFFSLEPDLTPYRQLSVPTQTASAEGRRIAALLLRTDQTGPDADVKRSARLIGLSLQADRLAAARARISPQTYAAEQAALYRDALQVVAPSNRR
jgi:DNA-binding beta-propeller fold protein YncE